MERSVSKERVVKLAKEWGYTNPTADCCQCGSSNTAWAMLDCPGGGRMLVYRCFDCRVENTRYQG